jgi:hypothetical protein
MGSFRQGLGVKLNTCLSLVPKWICMSTPMYALYKDTYLYFFISYIFHDRWVGFTCLLRNVTPLLIHAPQNLMDFLALWASESLFLPNYRCPFFSVHCVITISLRPFSTSSNHPTQGRRILVPSGLLKYFLKRPSMMPCPFHSFFF